MGTQSLVLCLFYTMYLIIGAVMFMFLEYQESEVVEVTELPEWTLLKGKKINAVIENGLNIILKFVTVGEYWQ